MDIHTYRQTDKRDEINGETKPVENCFSGVVIPFNIHNIFILPKTRVYGLPFGESLMISVEITPQCNRETDRHDDTY